jgi:hypothetical protein
MAKFVSFDGVDKNGVRAEVMVQTGTGKIKELVPRGKAAADGSYRNVEVVFTPDNPKLLRKVYALLDTTSKELWEYVQAVQADQKDISYRIESQRKRTIDRGIKFDDLTHSEQVVRILAGVDTLFSHEAKTTPTEDPSNDSPSALAQELSADAVLPTSAGASSGVPSVIDPSHLLNSLAEARSLNLSSTTIDTLVALAVNAGASLQDALSAGIGLEKEAQEPRSNVGRGFAIEEKPWTAYNSDGRVNVGSYMVAHAASAERFALDHLITIYSDGKKSNVDVTDEMIAQAASLALVLLELSDDVQRKVVGRTDRQKNSYNRAMALVLDAVDKRYPAPAGGNSEAQQTWRLSVVNESMERLNGILAVAEGKLPLADSFAGADEEPSTVAVAKTSVATKTNGANALKNALGAVEKPVSKASFPMPKKNPIPGDKTFVEPSAEVIGRLRDICVNAGVASETKAISDWLESAVGARVSRKVHSAVLEAFAGFYEAAGPEVVKTEVLSYK